MIIPHLRITLRALKLPAYPLGEVVHLVLVAAELADGAAHLGLEQIIVELIGQS